MLVTPLSEIVRIEGRAMDDDVRPAVALDRWQIEQADAVCCPSWGILDSYEQTMQLSLRNRPSVHHTPLGIAPMPAPPATSGPERTSAAVRRAIGSAQGNRRAARRAARLLAAYPEWQCDLVGHDHVLVPGTEVTYRAQFAATHAGAPWIDRVHFHGAVSDAALARFYAACDVFVAPSLLESFGLIFLEAMQYAKPVVGCRAGGVPEIVRDGVDGLLVEPGERRCTGGGARSTHVRCGPARVAGSRGIGPHARGLRPSRDGGAHAGGV
jgi:glycosyltransferase involved in cell wall biosynthesis